MSELYLDSIANMLSVVLLFISVRTREASLALKGLQSQIPPDDMAIGNLYVVKPLEGSVVWKEDNQLHQQVIPQSTNCPSESQALLLNSAAACLPLRQLPADVKYRAFSSQHLLRQNIPESCRVLLPVCIVRQPRITTHHIAHHTYPNLLNPGQYVPKIMGCTRQEPLKPSVEPSLGELKSSYSPNHCSATQFRSIQITCCQHWMCCSKIH